MWYQLPTMGLRARKKADCDRRILEAAAELFRLEGYDGAKMGAIARHAGVSPGTIYNYHHNKGDLLVAIVAMEVSEVLAAGEKILERPHKDAARAVNQLFAIYLDHSLVYLSKEMWRNAMAISMRQPETPSGRSYNELDQDLAGQVGTLISRLQTGGILRRDTDTTAIGQLLFNNLDRMFMNFVKSETMTLAELTSAVSAQSHAVLDGLKPASKSPLVKARPFVRPARSAWISS